MEREMFGFEPNPCVISITASTRRKKSNVKVYADF
jgi:hypothetical protein